MSVQQPKRYSVKRGGWTWHDRPKSPPAVCEDCGKVLKSHPDYRRTKKCRTCLYPNSKQTLDSRGSAR